MCTQAMLRRRAPTECSDSRGQVENEEDSETTWSQSRSAPANWYSFNRPLSETKLTIAETEAYLECSLKMTPHRTATAYSWRDARWGTIAQAKQSVPHRQIMAAGSMNHFQGGNPITRRLPVGSKARFRVCAADSPIASKLQKFSGAISRPSIRMPNFLSSAAAGERRSKRLKRPDPGSRIELELAKVELGAGSSKTRSSSWFSVRGSGCGIRIYKGREN